MNAAPSNSCARYGEIRAYTQGLSASVLQRVSISVIVNKDVASLHAASFKQNGIGLVIMALRRRHEYEPAVLVLMDVPLTKLLRPCPDLFHARIVVAPAWLARRAAAIPSHSIMDPTLWRQYCDKAMRYRDESDDYFTCLERNAPQTVKMAWRCRWSTQLFACISSITRCAARLRCMRLHYMWSPAGVNFARTWVPACRQSSNNKLPT
jgi:hypothetical protein